MKSQDGPCDCGFADAFADHSPIEAANAIAITGGRAEDMLVCSQCGIRWDQDLETPAVYQSSRSVSDCAGHRVAGDARRCGALAREAYKWFSLSYLQLT